MKTPRDIAKPGQTPLADLQLLKQAKKDGASSIAENIERLLERMERLEFCVAKMAHFSGNNRIILEVGLDPWKPKADDMRKFK